jgi:hypothetical protein
MRIIGPFNELELPDKRRLDPSTLLHLRGGQPCPAFFSGRLANGHSLICSGLNFLNNSRREAGVNPFARARRVHEVRPVVVADHQRIEVLGRRRASADYEFLTLIDAHLLPCARELAGLILMSAAFCDETLQALSFTGWTGF